MLIDIETQFLQLVNDRHCPIKLEARHPLCEGTDDIEFCLKCWVMRKYHEQHFGVENTETNAEASTLSVIKLLEAIGAVDSIIIAETNNKAILKATGSCSKPIMMMPAEMMRIRFGSANIVGLGKSAAVVIIGYLPDIFEEATSVNKAYVVQENVFTIEAIERAYTNLAYNWLPAGGCGNGQMGNRERAGVTNQLPGAADSDSPSEF